LKPLCRNLENSGPEGGPGSTLTNEPVWRDGPLAAVVG
jgi:hypothetical protein